MTNSTQERLSSILDILGGGTPKTSIQEYWNGNIPWLSVNDFNNDRKYVYSAEKSITPIGLKNSSARVLEKGDIIISARGTVGVVSMLKERMTFNQSCYGIRAKAGKSTNEYIYYLLKYTVPELKKISHGGVFDTITRNSFDEIIIDLPPIAYQESIISILSSLDNKIDLLHRQNETLEKMAETLFRQWFVEEKKEEWEEGKLSDLVVIKYGKDHKKLSEGHIPVYGSGGIMRFCDRPLYENESVLIPRKGSLNNIIYLNEPFWTVDTMFYTEMKHPNIAKFVYHYLNDIDFASMNVGSAVPSMTTEVLNNLVLKIPDEKFLIKFENTINPLYQKIKANHAQIKPLSILRDTLLPKLMSGEITLMNNNGN